MLLDLLISVATDRVDWVFIAVVGLSPAGVAGGSFIPNLGSGWNLASNRYTPAAGLNITNIIYLKLAISVESEPDVDHVFEFGNLL